MCGDARRTVPKGAFARRGRPPGGLLESPRGPMPICHFPSLPGSDPLELKHGRRGRRKSAMCLRTQINCLAYVVRFASLRGIGYPFFGGVFRMAADSSRLLARGGHPGQANYGRLTQAAQRLTFTLRGFKSSPLVAPVSVGLRPQGVDQCRRSIFHGAGIRRWANGTPLLTV